MQNQYHFQASPQPISLLKKPKKQPGAINITIYKNLMNDKRIRRGNNYSAYKKIEKFQKRISVTKKKKR